MLRYDAPADAASNYPVRKFLLMVLLMGSRDRADRIEFRYEPDWLRLWYRVDGAWYELVPPPRSVCPQVLAEVRRSSRLVTPERGTGWRARVGGLLARPGGPAAGWMTLRVRGREVLYAVRLDPSPERGVVVFEPVGPVLDPGDAEGVLAEMWPRDADGPYIEFDA